MRDERVEDLLVSEYEGEDITDSEEEEYEPEEDDTWYELASEEFLEDWGEKLECIEQSANQESVGDLTNALVYYAHGGTASLSVPHGFHQRWLWVLPGGEKRCVCTGLSECIPWSIPCV